MKRVLLFGLVAATFCSPVSADFYDGLHAYNAGKYQIAAQEWEKSAEEKDAMSMFELGKLYREGVGVPQSFVKAHLFFNMAGALGLAEARQARDRIAERMSDSERARAQQLAEKWPEPESAGADSLIQARKAKEIKLAANSQWRWLIKPVPGTTCESLDFGMLKIANGRATSMVKHPQDGPFPLQGDLLNSGKIYMAASGGHVSLTVEGMISGKKGKGKLEVAGELNCTGDWTIEKLR